MYDTTHSYVWHDSFICVTAIIHMCNGLTLSAPAMNGANKVRVHMGDTIYSYVWHASFISMIRFIHMCDMTHSYVWQQSFICVTGLLSLLLLWMAPKKYAFTCVIRLIHTCDFLIHTYALTHSRVCDRFVLSNPAVRGAKERFIHSCDDSFIRVTHLFVWHDSFIRVTWLIHTCVTDSFCSYLCRLIYIRDSFICLTWLKHVYDMTHSYVWHDSFIRVWLTNSFCPFCLRRQRSKRSCGSRLIHLCGSFIRVTWLKHIYYMTHSYVYDWFVLSAPAMGGAKKIHIHICYTAHSYICFRYAWRQINI